MITPILEILASIIGVVAAYAFTRYIVIPFLQKYQTWSDLKDNEKVIADSAKAQQNLNGEEVKNASREEADFKKLEDELNKPKEPK